MRFQLFLLILLAALLSTIVSSQEYSEVQTTDGLVPVDEGSKVNLEEHVRQKRGWLKRVWKEIKRSGGKIRKEVKRGFRKRWPKKPVPLFKYEKRF